MTLDELIAPYGCKDFTPFEVALVRAWRCGDKLRAITMICAVEYLRDNPLKESWALRVIEEFLAEEAEFEADMQAIREGSEAQLHQ